MGGECVDGEVFGEGCVEWVVCRGFVGGGTV